MNWRKGMDKRKQINKITLIENQSTASQKATSTYMYITLIQTIIKKSYHR